MGIHDGRLSFAPRLPDRLNRLEFSLLWQGPWLPGTISRSEATCSIRNGHDTAVELLHHGKPVTVRAGNPVRLPIPPSQRLTPPPSSRPAAHPCAAGSAR